MAEIHLTPKDLEARWTDTLRIKANTLANWRSSRPPRGPAYRRIGNKILYPLSAIEAFEQTGMDRSSTATPDPAAARPPAPPSAATSESAPIAALMATRDQARAEMTASLEALRRTAARLERHFSRRIDRVRGRLAGAAHPPAPSDASSEASTGEGASRSLRPRRPAPRVAARRRRRKDC